MNIEKFKVFLKEWKEDRVKNGNCEVDIWSLKCGLCPYSKIAYAKKSINVDDDEAFSICELLEMIEDTLISEDEIEGLYTREGMYGSDY